VQIPFIDLQTQLKHIRPQIDAAIQKVLDRGAFIMGPEVAQFEQDMQAFTGIPYALGCSDGTDALTMALMALNVQPGDAVFVPSFTFASTAEVVALRGAVPVFVGVHDTTYNMDPKCLLEAIEMVQKAGKHRPVGIISVDLFGQPADHQAMEAIAKEHGLWTIVDAAQSFGATYEGKSTVQYGDIATTSFFPAKPLGAFGDGGAVFTKDELLYEALKSIRIHGMAKKQYDYERFGLTGRLDTMQAAILIEKLKIFPWEIEQRQAAAEYYTTGLKDVVTTPIVCSKCTSVWAQYTIQVDNRTAVQEHLKAQGIPTMIYYPKPLHMQEPYAHYPRPPKGLPTTERIAGRVLSLPMHPYLERDVQDKIIAAVREAVKG
jgi:dTDP-4-amino-4,6-dideoxygalactose transaminase